MLEHLDDNWWRLDNSSIQINIKRRKNEKILNKIIALTTIIIISLSNTSYAAGNNNNNSETINAVTDGYTYWKVESKSNVGIVYGSYKYGPSGRGPCKLSMGSSRTDTYTNTISGEYSSIANISIPLGITIGVSQTRNVSYEISVPKGKVYWLKYRPFYKKYKVVERAYTMLDGKTIKTNSTKTSYVKVFQNWDYNYDVVK